MGMLQVNNTQFVDCFAESNGGGLSIHGMKRGTRDVNGVTLNDVSFTRCAVSNGGPSAQGEKIYAVGGALALWNLHYAEAAIYMRRVAFTNNTVYSRCTDIGSCSASDPADYPAPAAGGGAMWAFSQGPSDPVPSPCNEGICGHLKIYMWDSTFTGNKVTSFARKGFTAGGGVLLWEDDIQASIYNTHFDENSVNAFGGVYEGGGGGLFRKESRVLPGRAGHVYLQDKTVFTSNRVNIAATDWAHWRTINRFTRAEGLGHSFKTEGGETLYRMWAHHPSIPHCACLRMHT